MKDQYFRALFVIQIIIFFPLIFLIIIVWPILKVRIGEIKTRSLGSIALSPEIYLIDKKFGLYKKNDIFLWYHHRNIANKCLLEKRKEDLIFLPGFILYPIKLFFSKFRFTRKHVYYKFFYNERIKNFTAIPEKLRTNQKFLKNSNPFVKFSKKEIEEGNNYLEKNFINKNDKIVVFCSRTPIYRSESYISVRNSNIKNQMMSMNFVIDNNYKAVRVGRDKINKFEINNKNFFDYTFADQQSDFLDLFIISKAKFMVCGNTGVNEIATIMRIPRLIVDFSNFNFLYNFNEAFTPIILPKKLFSKSLKRYLNFKEIFEKKLFDGNIISEIPNDFQLIDNSEDEILEATKEMKELVENKLDLNTERIKQGNFWNLYAKFYGVKEGMIISPNFFKKNNKLFI